MPVPMGLGMKRKREQVEEQKRQEVPLKFLFSGFNLSAVERDLYNFDARQHLVLNSRMHLGMCSSIDLYDVVE